MASTRVATATMRAAQIAKPGVEFEVVEREIPKPGAGEVLIKVQACGVCHSDVFVKEEESARHPRRCRTVSAQAESGSAAVAREEYFNAVCGRRRQTVRIPLYSRRAGPADDEPVLARREF